MKSTYVLTEGAIQLAIFTVLFLASLYVPLLGTVTVLFLALPFIIFTVRHGYKNGLFLLAVSLIVSLLVGSVFSAPLALMFGTGGVVIGWLLAKKKNRYIILLVSTVVFLLNLIVQYMISIVFFDADVVKETVSLMKEYFANALKMMEAMGRKPPEEFIARFNQGLEFISYITPTLFVITAVAITYLTIIVSMPVLKRLKIETGAWPPFRDVVLPKSVFWYYFLTVALTFLPLEKGTFLYIAVLNMYFILQVLMMIQGFSFIHYFIYQKGWAKGIAIAVTVISLFMPFLLYLVAILGIIDLGFELRKQI